MSPLVRRGEINKHPQKTNKQNNNNVPTGVKYTCYAV